MLKSTPEYVSAHVREIASTAPTALAAEAIAHRRNQRRMKLSQFVASIYRATRFGNTSNAVEVAPSRPKPAI